MKQRRTLSSLLSLAMATGLAGSALWSEDSHACNNEPFVSSVCAMAWANIPTNGFGRTYLPADGRQVTVNGNEALFSLVGNTYGSTGTAYFNLPDLRGRILVGAGTGPGLTPLAVGLKGGATSVTLTAANLPPHAHALGMGTGRVSVTWQPGSLAGTITPAGLTATTAVGSLAGTVDASTLKLMAAPAGGTATTQPAGAALGPATAAIYNPAATPGATMAAGSIANSGSSTNVNLSLSSPLTTTITGSGTPTLTGAPNITLSGTTESAGSSAAVPTMPPYLALGYYIAVTGYYPTSN